MHSITTISHFVEMHDFWATILLIIGVVIEGEFILIIAGILAHLGGLSLFEVLFFGYVGSVLKTITWYMLGGWLKKRYPDSSLLLYIEKKVLAILPRFKQRPFWSIFVSKFIYGINHFTLIFAGYMNINRKIYFKAEYISSVFWVLGLLMLGFFFSHAAFGISHDIRKFTIVIIGFILGFIILQKIISFIYELVEEYAKK